MSNGKCYQWKYDNRGNVIKEIDSSGKTIHVSPYDKRNNLKTKTVLNTQTLNYEYNFNLNDKLTEMICCDETILKIEY